MSLSSMTMPTVIDHLVVTAPTLEVGAAYVHRRLGVTPQTGGAHAKMGTHNLLQRLDEAIYLEVIAVDPDAAAPSRARWFGLDDLRRDAPPSLARWVARTGDIGSTAARASEDLGSIETMTRGDLTWMITIAPHGAENTHAALGGCAPALIEWRGDMQPASRLHDAGLRLVRLELHHPDPERLQKLLEAIDLDTAFDIVRIERGLRAQLVATIATPRGVRTISSA